MDKTLGWMQITRSAFSRLFTGSALALVMCTSLMAIPIAEANAQRDNKDEKPAEGRQFGSKTGAMVNEALQFFNTDQYSAALGPLSQALALPDLNPYERSTIHQMQGSAYYELDQLPQAISAFENAISAGGLLPKEAAGLRINIAQLLIATDQPGRGAQMLEDWNRNGGQLKPQHIEMLWQAWSQADQYGRALPWAERWFNAASPKERKHFDTLNYMYNNLNMPEKQADIVKQMINRWPQENNLWAAWQSMLMQGGREGEAFEVSKMLYLGGAYSEEQDFMKVVQYYAYYEMPFQAAQILEREMNAGRIQETSDRLVELSNHLRQAREYKRAIPVLEKAARASGKAKLYADLGEALVNERQCAKSETAFKKAMELGFNQGKAWSLVASCRYDSAAEENRLTCDMSKEQIASAPRTVKAKQAIDAFDLVPASSSLSRDARTWKKFIRSEAKQFENRCIYEANVEKERCFIAIKQSYSNLVFAGRFILDDDACMVYKDAYDAKFRKKASESEDE